MKAIAPNLFERGKRRSLYLRRRIPTDLLEAYPPNKTHIVVCLGTSDVVRAKERQRVEEVRIDAEFSRLREELKAKSVLKARVKVSKLTDAHIRSMADFWVRQTLLADDNRRVRGLDDEEFDSLDQQLTEQRAQLGRMLATGRTDKILPALHSFLYLCGIDVELAAEDSHRIGYQFLRAVVTALDHQLERQKGAQVDVDVVAPAMPSPKELVVQEMLSKQASENAAVQAEKDEPTWDEIFALWRDHVRGRPKSTAIATKTPWNELQRIATEQGILYPSKVTPELMDMFVDTMDARLEVVTLNERLAKVKSVFKIAVSKRKMPSNPAALTVGRAEHSLAKRQKRRLPFDSDDLHTLFSSAVFNECQLRSQGQSGEATYWIPVLMFYTGARPEELAGLAVTDIKHDPVHGWYFDILDHPDDDDDVFEDEKKEAKKASRKSSDASTEKAPVRILKNGESIRKVPMAAQLIDLGLLRYVEWIKSQGKLALFPTLSADWHGKLSGAFSKFFGRYKREVLGIESPKKVLYSLRHNMKDFMTRARIPSKYLQRILGHATGDGEVTDGYGDEDLPLEFLVDEFKRINFPEIPVHPWMPGKGSVRLKRKPEEEDAE
jgi:integrase